VSEEDEDAGEADEAEEVVDVMLVADHESAVVAQPSKEPLHLPAPLVSPELPAVLRLLAVAPAMKRDPSVSPTSLTTR
jgi:hypothetical protein